RHKSIIPPTTLPIQVVALGDQLCSSACCRFDDNINEGLSCSISPMGRGKIETFHKNERVELVGLGLEPNARIDASLKGRPGGRTKCWCAWMLVSRMLRPLCHLVVALSLRPVEDSLLWADVEMVRGVGIWRFGARGIRLLLPLPPCPGIHLDGLGAVWSHVHVVFVLVKEAFRQASLGLDVFPALMFNPMSPYYLTSGDNMSIVVTLVQLKGDNYDEWSKNLSKPRLLQNSCRIVVTKGHAPIVENMVMKPMTVFKLLVELKEKQKRNCGTHKKGTSQGRETRTANVTQVQQTQGTIDVQIGGVTYERGSFPRLSNYQWSALVNILNTPKLTSSIEKFNSKQAKNS
ncbi:hypothetical protein CR513_23194, partial [Mucuna pruriens]